MVNSVVVFSAKLISIFLQQDFPIFDKDDIIKNIFDIGNQVGRDQHRRIL